jgi:geranylgeranyl pyrophosphate synthase
MKESGGAAGTPAEQRARVATVTGIYQRHGVIEAARDQIQRDTTKATVSLALLPANSATAMLRWFSEMLLKRTS